MLTIKSNFINYRDRLGQEYTDEDLTRLASAVLSFRENNGTNIGRGFPSTITAKIIEKISGKPESILIINDVSLHMTKALLEAGYQMENIYLAFGKWEKNATPSSDRTIVKLMKNYVRANFNEAFNIISLGGVFMAEKSWGLIIANPPYNKNLHLNILNKLKEACPKAEIVSLSPIAPLYEHFAYGRSIILKNPFEWSIKEIIEEHEAETAFGLSNIGSDLGIWWSRQDSKSTETQLQYELFGAKASLIQKLWKAFENTDKLANHVLTYSQCTKPNIVKFVYGLSLSNHGLVTTSSYNLTSLTFMTATTGVDSSHTRYIETNNLEEQKAVHAFYCSTIMRFFYKEVLRGRCDYTLIPWFTPAELTAKPIKFLSEFCGLTADELALIQTTMTPYLPAAK